QVPPEGAGLIVLPDGLVLSPFSPSPDFGPLKDYLSNKIDAEAEQLRGLFATPGSGQAMEYQEAVAQARALLDGQTGPFPMLTAGVVAGTRGPRTGSAVATETEAADVVLWMHSLWVDIGSAIRTARLTAKVSVRAGETLGPIVMAAQVDWAHVIQDATP